MTLHPRLTRATLELVTRFETFQGEAKPAPEGGWTIGYGHTRSAREGARVSRSDAEALLLYDLAASAGDVQEALYAPVTQRQFEALTAFAFNIGTENFRRSTALARVNAGAELEAADEIERWRHAELGAGAQVVDALVRRRAAEKAHFLGLPEGFSKSPSALLRPLAEGGLEPEAIEPPPLDLSAPHAPPQASATRDAADGIQARLRALIPDAEPLPFAAASPQPAVAGPLAETATGAAAMGARQAAPAVVDRPTEPPPPVAAPPPANDTVPLPAQLPPPPPFIAPQPVALPADDPEREAGPAAPEPVIKPAPGPAFASEPARVRRLATPRRLHLLLIAVGACLFVAAVVLILGGKPSFANLGLGVIGALALTPGVYGLLGPRPEPRPDASS